MWGALLHEQSPHKDGSEEGGSGESGVTTGYTHSASTATRKHGDMHFQPAQFVGPISNIVKKFPEGLQIQRVYMYICTCVYMNNCKHIDVMNEVTQCVIVHCVQCMYMYMCIVQS